MSFLGIMGMNLAMNFIGKMLSPQSPAINPTYFNSMNSVLSSNQNKTADLNEVFDEQQVQSQISFESELPTAPQDSINKFTDMIASQETDKMAYLNKMQAEKNQAKDDFFKENHYETTTGKDGKQQIALGEDGKPVIKQGPESESQKNARLNYEASQKADMFTKHSSEKQQFVQEQRTSIQAFLDTNKFQLSNPAIQGELQKIILDSQKKAVKLQDEHEKEFYLSDVPEVPEIQEKVASNLEGYKELVQSQLEAQQNSPEVQELAMFQQDLVAMLDAKRAEARDRKKTEQFLMTPMQMMNPPKEDLVTVLPTNMVMALEQFGITGV